MALRPGAGGGGSFMFPVAGGLGPPQGMMSMQQQPQQQQQGYGMVPGMQPNMPSMMGMSFGPQIPTGPMAMQGGMTMGQMAAAGMAYMGQPTYMGMRPPTSQYTADMQKQFAEEQQRRYEHQQKILEEERKRRQFEEQKQKLRLLSSVKPKTGEKSRDDALEAIKGNLDGFTREAKMHPTPVSHPTKTGHSMPSHSAVSHPHPPVFHDDDEFCDFIQGPADAPGPSTLSQTFQSSQPAAQARVLPSDQSGSLAHPFPSVHAPASSALLGTVGQIPMNPVTTTSQSESIKGPSLEETLLASCDLHASKRAQVAFKTSQHFAEVHSQSFTSAQFQSSSKARNWSAVDKNLSGIFTSEIPKASESMCPNEESGVGVFPSQDPIQPVLPHWVYNDGLVPDLYKKVLETTMTPSGIDTAKLYPILMASGLPRETLGQIWGMANRTTPGQLIKEELYMVLAMIAMTQRGIPAMSLDAFSQLQAAPVPTLSGSPLSMPPTVPPQPMLSMLAAPGVSVPLSIGQPVMGLNMTAPVTSTAPPISTGFMMSFPVPQVRTALCIFVEQSENEAGTMAEKQIREAESIKAYLADGVHLQLGVAMGSPCGGSVANLVTAYWESEFVFKGNLFFESFLYYTRFLDDIFILLKGSESVSHQIIDYFNHTTEFLQFTHMFNCDCIDYLDIHLSKNYNLNLFTANIFRKPTYSNTFLHYTSCHPHYQKKSVVKGQLVRASRMVSLDEDFKQECAHIREMFIHRGYPVTFLDPTVQEVMDKRHNKVYIPLLNINTKNLIDDNSANLVDKNLCDQEGSNALISGRFNNELCTVKSITTFSTTSTLCSSILKKNWDLFKIQPDLFEKLGDHPMIVYRKGLNIKNLLEKHDTLTEDKLVKKMWKNDKRLWVEKLAAEAETAAAIGNSRPLYRVAKELRDENKHRPYDLHDFGNDGKVSTMILDVNLADFSEIEVKEAIAKLKNGKAPGTDQIQSELLKYAVSSVEYFTYLLNNIWTPEKVPNELENGIIIPLPKKGDIRDCTNWHGAHRLIDWVMRKALHGNSVELEWIDDNKLLDLDFAHDIALIDITWSEMQTVTTSVEKQGGKVGLKMNPDKCKVLVRKAWNDNQDITAAGINIRHNRELLLPGQFHLSYSAPCVITPVSTTVTSSSDKYAVFTQMTTNKSEAPLSSFTEFGDKYSVFRELEQTAESKPVGDGFEDFRSAGADDGFTDFKTADTISPLETSEKDKPFTASFPPAPSLKQQLQSQQQMQTKLPLKVSDLDLFSLTSSGENKSLSLSQESVSSSFPLPLSSSSTSSNAAGKSSTLVDDFGDFSIFGDSSSATSSGRNDFADFMAFSNTTGFSEQKSENKYNTLKQEGGSVLTSNSYMSVNENGQHHLSSVSDKYDVFKQLSLEGFEEQKDSTFSSVKGEDDFADFQTGKFSSGLSNSDKVLIDKVAAFRHAKEDSASVKSLDLPSIGGSSIGKEDSEDALSVQFDMKLSDVGGDLKHVMSDSSLDLPPVSGQHPPAADMDDLKFLSLTNNSNSSAINNLAHCETAAVDQPSAFFLSSETMSSSTTSILQRKETSFGSSENITMTVTSKVTTCLNKDSSTTDNFDEFTDFKDHTLGTAKQIMDSEFGNFAGTLPDVEISLSTLNQNGVLPSFASNGVPSDLEKKELTDDFGEFQREKPKISKFDFLVASSQGKIKSSEEMIKNELATFDLSVQGSHKRSLSLGDKEINHTVHPPPQEQGFRDRSNTLNERPALPVIRDRYKDLTGEVEESERYAYEWQRCLESVLQVIRKANDTLNGISSSSICTEVIQSTQGMEYLLGVVEVYRVARRVELGIKATAVCSEKLQHLLKDIERVWNNLIGFMSLASLTPDDSSLDFSTCMLRPGIKNAKELACGVCLLNVESRSKAFDSEIDCFKLAYGGHQYHASCANFWINCVEPKPPGLVLPDLL
ncbi:synergin gamma [Protopterus annectens]|uniref:synergin gamma n=1 Tax=Protopterus annectens TaxID=7888 RepID=UPI001CFA5DC3|nr:synergin gamma [Protopterus annectens]